MLIYCLKVPQESLYGVVRIFITDFSGNVILKVGSLKETNIEKYQFWVNYAECSKNVKLLLQNHSFHDDLQTPQNIKSDYSFGRAQRTILKSKYFRLMDRIPNDNKTIIEFSCFHEFVHIKDLITGDKLRVWSPCNQPLSSVSLMTYIM